MMMEIFAWDVWNGASNFMEGGGGGCQWKRLGRRDGGKGVRVLSELRGPFCVATPPVDDVMFFFDELKGAFFDFFFGACRERENKKKWVELPQRRKGIFFQPDHQKKIESQKTKNKKKIKKIKKK